MNILHANAFDITGGAARAAYRIHRSMVEHGASHGLTSHMRVISRLSNDPTVIGTAPKRRSLIPLRLENRLNNYIRRTFSTSNPSLHSIARSSTGLREDLQQRHRKGYADLVHLHWLGDLTLSIEDIGRLPMPLVWTLHDQWAFCGAEHYTSLPIQGDLPSSDERYALAYSPVSRPVHERGLDLNRRTWLRKRRAWRRPIHIVCPSQWMADCVRRSTLMCNWPISVIPNPIDLRVWARCDQAQARSLHGLPLDRPLVLFGAMGGSSDPRKGVDLLLEALQILRSQVEGTQLENLELVVFGQNQPAQSPKLGFPIHYIGHLYDDLSLRLLYAAADVFVIPSRQDNLPNTGLEAHACGIPVVAFRTGGLIDIVEHQITGALASPFDPISLAAMIRWVLANPHRRRNLGFAARQRAQRLWDPALVAKSYADVYTQVLDQPAKNY